MVRSPVWPRNGPEAWSRMDRDNHRRWLWLVLGEGAEQTRPRSTTALFSSSKTFVGILAPLGLGPRFPTILKLYGVWADEYSRHQAVLTRA